MPLPCLHLAARFAALAILTATLAGCQGIAGIQPTSQVRVIAVSPDAPALDMYQSATPIHQNSAALYNVGFGTVSSYIPVAPGPYTHAAYTAGTQQQLAAVRGSFLSGGQYTIITGNVASSLQMTVLKDQSTPAPAGDIAIRFLDQTTRAGAVDLYLLSPGAAPSGVAPIVTAATFGTNTGYINAPAGTYSILAYPTGTVPTSATLPEYTGSQVTYPSGSARTIILIDQPPSGLQSITAADFDPAAS
jgi:hypothetical protein